MNNIVNSSTESPEVIPKARRRRFSVAYKLRMLREAEAWTDRRAVGALLRKKGGKGVMGGSPDWHGVCRARLDVIPLRHLRTTGPERIRRACNQIMKY